MKQASEQMMGMVGWASPEQVAEGAIGLLPSEGDWYVLHTRSRQEKVLHQTLHASGIGCFLPLMKVIRFYGKRKARIEEPMFPGYIFMRGSREQAFAADRTGRIVQIIPVVEQEQLDWELTNLHLAVRGTAPLEPFACLKEGMRVEVRSGPFRGIQGIIEHRDAPDRLHLQVAMLGRSMSMEVDASLLDPID